MKKNVLNKAGQQLINGAYDPKNWRFTKDAKQTMIGSGLLIVSAIVLVNILKKWQNLQTVFHAVLL